VFQSGDLVTFTDHLTLFDANSCLVTYRGNLVKDPYDKPGRQWVVMAAIPASAYANTEVLFLLCPIAEGPVEHDGEAGIELPEGTFGLINHDTWFQRAAATVAPVGALRPWRVKSKAKARQGMHSLAGQPEWPDMEKAFWKLWSKAVESPVKRWNKLVALRAKTGDVKKPKGKP
jgi:hypothetical protein